VLLLLVSFVGLFPLSVRIADPLATRRFDPSVDARILLLWPDHIELRPVRSLSKISPRPADAEYTFLVPTERRAWVTSSLRNDPHSGDASWIIHLKPLGPAKQRIQLELLGDGYCGIVYEATVDGIRPLGTRLAGPGFAVVILGVHLACWGGLWVAVSLLSQLLHLAGAAQ
jgi:hypothetical protein